VGRSQLSESVMLPSNLIVEFWDRVRHDLRERHCLTELDTNVAMNRYRHVLERHQMGDWTYHSNPETISDTIAKGWIRGFPPPEGWVEQRDS
jgi:hypothetical protein